MASHSVFSCFQAQGIADLEVDRSNKKEFKQEDNYTNPHWLAKKENIFSNINQVMKLHGVMLFLT